MAESEMANFVGFRFHPTDEELVNFFLRNKNLGNESAVKAINEIEICRFDPWDLPWQSKLPSDDRVWFFFCPRVSRFSNSQRINRTTRTGFWKSTGRDRKIRAKRNRNVVIGTKKTLVFHLGRGSDGQRTDWVMHEYRPVEQKTFVLCKVKDKRGENTGASSSKGNESSLASESNNLAATNPAFEVNQPVQETPEYSREHGLSVAELDLLTEAEPRFLNAVQPSWQDVLTLAELERPNEITSDYNVQRPSDILTKANLELLKAEQASGPEGMTLTELERPNEIAFDYNVQRPTDLLTETDLEFLKTVQPGWLEGTEITSDYDMQLPLDLFTEPHLEFMNGFEHGNGMFLEEQFLNQDHFLLETSVHEHYNHYRPPQPLPDVYEGDSSDSEAETTSAAGDSPSTRLTHSRPSISLTVYSYQEASSPGESVGSSKENRQTPVHGFHGTQKGEAAAQESSSELSEDRAPTVMTYQEASSPGESIGSSKENCQTPVHGFNGIQNDGSADALSSTNAGKSRYESKKTSDADEHPTEIQFQGKAMDSEAPIKTAEAVDHESTSELSEDEEPAIMVREASEKGCSTRNGTEKGSYVLMEMVEICRKPDQMFASMLNVVVGCILFVVTIRGMLSFH